MQKTLTIEGKIATILKMRKRDDAYVYKVLIDSNIEYYIKDFGDMIKVSSVYHKAFNDAFNGQEEFFKEFFEAFSDG